MALIRCVECGREISDNAASCPYCGYKTRLGEYAAKNKSLQTKKWCYTAMFLIGFVLFVFNVGVLYDRYNEWELADGLIRDIWGSTKVTFVQYLGVYNERGVLWATIIGASMTLWGAIGALTNIGQRKRNKIEESNARILYASNMQGNGQADLWTCLGCGQVNVGRVAYCQHCGTAKNWAVTQRNNVAAEQNAAFCIHCGAAVQRDDVFCMQCGAKIGSQ